MLANPKYLLQHAKENHYAIPHTNICDLHTARAIIQLCDRLKKPVIIGMAEVHFPFLGLEEAANLVKFYAAKTEAPVALHLDHGGSFDIVKDAISLGYTSVMIDGSKLPFDENVKLVKQVVDYAHYYGVHVEAELGHVGEGSAYEANNQELKDLYTKPEEAAEFVKLTGVDCLAVAIGTAHGQYVGTPEIDYNRLAELRKAVDVPLVLHGSSGTGLDKIGKCVDGGINKVNIFTDLSFAARDYIAANPMLKYEEFTTNAEKSIQDELTRYFQVLKTL